MLHLIGLQHGHGLAAQVSEQFIHDRIRSARDHQRMALPARLGVRHPKLVKVIKLMEESLEEPITRARLAHAVGLSSRQQTGRASCRERVCQYVLISESV